jgi:hypothetical protein
VTDFEGLTGALTRGGVEFIVVGGLAATAHGSSRLTQDVDVVYRRTMPNLARLIAALSPLHPYLRGAPPGLPFEWSTTTLRGGLNFTLTTSLGDLDLLGEIAGGGSYDQLLPHTVALDLFGHPCRCLDLEWLLRTKRAAGRPRDLEAIAELEALREELGDGPGRRG